MPPTQIPRQLLVWSVPTVALLLSFFWYKKKKNNIRANCDSLDPSTSTRLSEPEENKVDLPSAEASKPIIYSRSLSGVETAPIDIKTPRSTPIIVSDTDLDLEISKLKSMKTGTFKDKQLTPEMIATPVKKNSKTGTPLKSLSNENTPVKNRNSLKTATSLKSNCSPKTVTPSKSVNNDNDKSSDNCTSKAATKSKSTSNKSTPVKNSPKPETPSKLANDTIVKNCNSTNCSPKAVVPSKSISNVNTPVRNRSVDRDSANHSPSLIPVSLSSSSISDSHSDNDSGNGGSDVATPPPIQQQQQPSVTPSDIDTVVPIATISTYEFIIPQQLVGRLIGRHGAFAHEIKEKTNARILIKKHLEPGSKLKICAVEGTDQDIKAALDLIREKFPLKRYPEVTLERVTYVTVVSNCMHLRLIEGLNNDTIVSCVVNLQHLFLQHPTHPTFPSLNMLSDYMQSCYAGVYDVSLAPPSLNPVTENVICAAQSNGNWFRTCITSIDNDAKVACVQFLDFGGFANVPFSALRQIRGDFLYLPFQATECFLANIEPIESEENTEWCQEAVKTILELTTGVVAITQVVDYSEDDGVTPLVHIYIQSHEGDNIVLLNRVLVERGFARWVDYTR